VFFSTDLGGLRLAQLYPTIFHGNVFMLFESARQFLSMPSSKKREFVKVREPLEY